MRRLAVSWALDCAAAGTAHAASAPAPATDSRARRSISCISTSISRYGGGIIIRAAAGASPLRHFHRRPFLALCAPSVESTPRKEGPMRPLRALVVVAALLVAVPSFAQQWT